MSGFLIIFCHAGIFYSLCVSYVIFLLIVIIIQGPQEYPYHLSLYHLKEGSACTIQII